MEDRKQKLLKSIIELYINTAKPISSKILAEDESFSLSSATIRNDMLELENLGYICQPHTSAGRLPTVSGYRYYLDNLLSVYVLPEVEKKELADLAQQDIRLLAKYLAEKINLAVIVGFSPTDLYFTGLFNLFSQPEFEDYKMVLSMSQVVDSLEKATAKIFYQIDKPQVLLGKENPFNPYCATAIAPLAQDRILAILGPIRMDYNRVLSLLSAVVKIV